MTFKAVRTLVNVRESRVSWYTSNRVSHIFMGNVAFLQGIVGEQNDECVGKVGIALPIHTEKSSIERKH